VSVSLKITAQPPPEIRVSPKDLRYVAKVGTNPPAQALRIKNSGEGTLIYDVTWDVPWLAVSPAGGPSGGGERTHTVSVDSRNMAVGNYDGAITVSADDAKNSPQFVTVSLRVSTTAPPPPPSTNNWISVWCNPSSGGTGTTVSVSISIDGNLQVIETFALTLTFDPLLFNYGNTTSGNLTGGWFVDGNASGGVVTIGGARFSASPIPVGSSGTIAVVTLTVTGASYSDGYVSQLTIGSLNDGISGMQPHPGTASFTYRK
jgi:hypothetical protein